jgi:succinyl-diaminopimelate desuccinylase
VIFNGHLDVWGGRPEQFEPFIKDGRLFGSGSYDMKAADLAMADVFCEFVNKTPQRLALQFATDEESAGTDGTAYQIRQGVRSKFVICGECGRPEDRYEIANSAKGIVIANIGLPGQNAHSAYPWRGDNAAVRASRFIQSLHERYPTPLKETPESTIAITGLTAIGASVTTIPDRANLRLNARFAPRDPILGDKTAFAEFIKSIDPTAEIDLPVFYAAFYTPPDNLQLRRLRAAAEKVEKHAFRLIQRHGTSDGHWYGAVGDNACEFGIAGENQHADGENITVEAFRNYHETLRTFLNPDTKLAT